jgi:hypothetical protein
MFGGRRSVPFSQRSNADLAVGLVWYAVLTLMVTGYLGYFLYQSDFRGPAIPMLLLLAVIGFFLWLGLGAMWGAGRELWRRKHKVGRSHHDNQAD